VRPPGQPLAERAPGAVKTAVMVRALAERGEATLARYLPLHDTGSWSLYGLLTPGYPWRGFLADAGYHCYHVRLLRMLAPLAPDRGFAAVADRWAGYAIRAGVRCRA
jgi:D-glucuronyl C5-epimerase C-terminus